MVGGDERGFFTVSTVLGADGRPSALLGLTEAAKASGQLQHQIVLELRQGLLGTSRYEVTITLAGEQFLAAYRQDRLAKTMARSALASKVPIETLLNELDRADAVPDQPAIGQDTRHLDPASTR